MTSKLSTGIQKILIIDDDPVQSNVIRMMLELYGLHECEITIAKDGTDGLKRVAAAPDPFSVILTDWRMPRMNGIEFIEAFRKNSVNEGTPVILVTFFAREDERLKSEGSVADAIMFKPVTPQGLVDTINAAWAARQPGQ
ncbi:MAG: response regulator [Rhodospirillales bacterium]|nr:response regulator [Rhodospirillales bacterium]